MPINENKSNLCINKNVRDKLREISEKRKAEGHPFSSMAAICHELILKQHKRECK